VDEWGYVDVHWGFSFIWTFHGDQWENVKLLVALALAPGKIVLAALLGIPRYILQALRLRARNRRLNRDAEITGRRRAH